MSTQTLTIQEFLEARLDEDEQIARAAKWAGMGSFIDPERALADVAAKRAILHQHGNGDGAHECPDGFMDSAETEPHTGYELNCMTVRLLASVYRSDPDYREEWAV